MEDTANHEAGAVGGADRRRYLHVIPAKEMLPEDQDTWIRTHSLFLEDVGNGSLGLLQRCAITARSTKWDVMVSAGGLHGGTHGPLKGCYVRLIIFQ